MLSQTTQKGFSASNYSCQLIMNNAGIIATKTPYLRSLMRQPPRLQKTSRMLSSATTNKRQQLPSSSASTTTARTACSSAPTTTASTASTAASNELSRTEFRTLLCEQTPERIELVNKLKRLYCDVVVPLERQYRFEEFYSQPLGDADFEAKAMILFVGQYSTGKSSMIR